MIDVSCEKIIRTLDVNRFVETGTDMGETVAEASRWFSALSPDFGRITGFFETGEQSYNTWNTPIQYPKFADCKDSRFKVYSVDLDQNAYLKAKENFSSNPNVIPVHESSESFLRRLLAEDAKPPRNTYFFFLDAHWGKYWPIRDELRVISTLPKFIIAIDDFFVPGKSDIGKPRSEFGFDFYHKRILCWGYIHDSFNQRPVRVFYPKTPNRDLRGWCLITGGYSEEELSFLRDLSLVELVANDPEHVRMLVPRLSTYWDLRVVLRMFFPLAWLRQGFRVLQSLRARLASKRSCP